MKISSPICYWVLTHWSISYFVYALQVREFQERLEWFTWWIYRVTVFCMKLVWSEAESGENRVPLVLVSANFGVPFSTAQMIFSFYRACSMSLCLNECHYFQFNPQFWTLHEIIWETLNLNQEYAINQFFYIFFHSSIDSLELLIALQFFKGHKCFAATLIQLGVLNPNTTTHYNFLTDTINTTKHKSSSKLLSSITQYNVVRFMVHANLTKWVHHAYEVNTIHIVPHINTD